MATAPAETLHELVYEPGCPTFSLLPRQTIATLFENAQETGQSPSEYLSMSLDPETRIRLQGMADLLNSPGITELIDGNALTLTMIKPHTELNAMGLADADFCRIVRDRAKQTGFLPLVEVSLPLPPEFWDEFFHPREIQTMKSIRPERHPDGNPQTQYRDRWTQYKNQLSSGPTTFLALYHPQGAAVIRWRAEMGHRWNPDRCFRNSLRRLYARNPYNNLVHGADSIPAVKREIGLVREYLHFLSS